MTTFELPTTSAARRPARTRLAGPTGFVATTAIAVAFGLLPGLGDLPWMRGMAAPWRSSADTSAPWAVSAFVLGALLRVGPGRAAYAGVVAEIVAVDAYYAGVVGSNMSDLQVLWAPSTVMWLMFGVVTGLVWGPAAAVYRSGSWWAAGAALGSAAGVLGGEAVRSLHLLHTDAPGYRGETWHVDVALLGAGAAVLVLGSPLRIRHPGIALVGVLAAGPAVVACAAAFTLAGFGG